MNNDEQTPISFAELAPRQDLWPGIESRITRRRPWKGFAVGMAASVVVALSAILAMPASQTDLNLLGRADAMLAQHQVTVAPWLEQPVASDVQPALDSLASAEMQIMQALHNEAENPALLRMLARVHRQRIDLLVKTQPQGRYIS